MPLPAYERGMTRTAIVKAPAGLRLREASIRVPAGRRAAVAALVSSWDLKRRVGFGAPTERPEPDAKGMLSLRVLWVTFREPVRVVWAGDAGFGYETRPGHPLHGEESFVLDEDGVFTVRSLSCPASPVWRLAWPMLRVMQRRTTASYLRAVAVAATTDRDMGATSRKGQ